MFRIGHEADGESWALLGVGPMSLAAKPMVGFVECSDETIADDALRQKLIALCLAFNKTLPPK
jgi:hypothetical protein